MNSIFTILIVFVPCAFCLLDKQLGEDCASASDCATAYSGCKNKKCTCIDGFNSAKGLCQPPSKQCPTFDCPPGFQCTFEPGKDCEHRIDFSTGQESHNCNNLTEFCFVHPNEKNEKGASVGHCCKRPPNGVGNIKMVCPYKANDPKGTCPDTSSLPVDSVAPKNLTRTCSYQTHDCVHHFKKAACCPIPCHGASSHFSVNGKCYDYVQIGDACNFPVQCIGGSDCVRAPSKSTGRACFCSKGQVVDEPSPHCSDFGALPPTPETPRGVLKNGDKCKYTEECRKEFVCQTSETDPKNKRCMPSGDTDTPVTPPPTPETPRGVLKNGDKCKYTEECRKEFVCQTSETDPKNKRCMPSGDTDSSAPKKQLGASCNAPDDCVEDLVCSSMHGAGTPLTCQKPFSDKKQIGDECSGPDSCVSGALCVSSPTSSTGRKCLSSG